MARINRRGFMTGCTAGIAAMAGSQFNYVAFGDQEEEPTHEIMVVVFLRGGLDGLNLIPVIDGADRQHYEAARKVLAIPSTGDGAALHLNDQFGLHPSAAPLLDLYQDQKMAVILAAGQQEGTRSHFDAMQSMELGTLGKTRSTTGWLTRHLQTAGEIPDEVLMPAVATGSLQPTSLAGSLESIGIRRPKDFAFNGSSRYRNLQRNMLRKMYGSGDTPLHQAGLQTLNAIDVMEFAAPENYVPENRANYPNGSFGNHLQSIAQLIKQQLGLRVATVDLGGWDTHDGQGNGSSGYFASHVGQLAQGLNAFYTDLGTSRSGRCPGQRVTTIVMSEFGRSLGENGSEGTDHGHGNVMLVLGHRVNGGQLYGTWPGLASDQLYDGRDVQITTDYRQVVSEVLMRRLHNPNLGLVFPEYSGYVPLDIVQGATLEPNYTETVVVPDVPPEAPLECAERAGHDVFLPNIAR